MLDYASDPWLASSGTTQPPLSWVFSKNPKPFSPLSLSLSGKDSQSFPLPSYSQDLDIMLFLTRVLKADQGWGIYHPSDHRRCHADVERHTIYVTYVLLLPVSQSQESSQQ